MQNECGAFLLVYQTAKMFLCNFLLQFWSFVVWVCPSFSKFQPSISILLNIVWWWLSQRRPALSVFSQSQQCDTGLCMQSVACGSLSNILSQTGGRQAGLIDLQVLVLTRTRQSGGNKLCHGYYRIWNKTDTHNALDLQFQTFSQTHTCAHAQTQVWRQACRHTQTSLSLSSTWDFHFLSLACETEQDD